MIKNNPYISHCDSSTFSVLFNNFAHEKNIRFILSIIKYPNWQEKIDLLKFVEDLDILRNNPRTYFVFDASTEGFSPYKTFFFDNLYYSCKVNSINPQKIIFVSANMSDRQNIEQYNKKKRITNSIKVFTFLNFKKMIADLVEDYFGFYFNSDSALDYFQKQTVSKFVDKHGLSLSRVNRDHRILANYLLYQSNASSKFHISQNSVSGKESELILKKYQLNPDSFNKWRASLPLTIDTKDFETNHALSLNSHLHTSTLFQIVNETHVNDWNGTSLFYSEKTFRSMAHMQPFLIFGQPNCNSRLEDFGFKLYHNMFDYSFDSIKDTKKRYQAILDTIKHAINRLDKMSRKQQIEWKFSQESVLKHNFECLMDPDFEKKNFRRLIESL